ncbi:hypothetical protein BLNAU_14718 [Blattamonas nauphoetae]|uniref:Uncharacterized protein n=1 Tax=Blattamonas nauphoetae TaxID=2049346 RepID=A0ABQ9XD00_9EUKA|nr:hypothetical protein BLNAU_14718 [Blattamonas nauphoetae]
MILKVPLVSYSSPPPQELTWLSHSLSTNIDVAGQVNLTSLEMTTTATFSSTSGKQTVAQSSEGTGRMNKISHTLSFVSLMFSLDYSRLISSLFRISAGTFSLTACDTGTPTMTSLSETCLSLADIADGASLSLTGSVFQNVKLYHPSLGTAIVLRLGSSFSSDTTSLFSRHLVDSPVAILRPPQNNNGASSQKKKNNRNAKEAMLDVDANGEDPPNSGLPQLPCRTLEIDFASLKATNFSVCFCVSRLPPTHILLIRHQLSSSLGSSVTTTITCCISSSAPLISPTLSSSSQQDSWDLNFSGISFPEPSSNDAPTGTLVIISGSSFATQIVYRFTHNHVLLLHIVLRIHIFLNHVCHHPTPQLVTLSNTSFVSGNSTASTRSGVLDVTLSEGSTFTLTHSSKPFPSCSSPKATTNLIFISHPSLSESVLSSSLDFDWTTGSDSLMDFAVKEGDHPVSVTLFLYFSSLGDEMIISNDSCDVSVCGFSEYPCASLTAFHSRIGDTPDKTVTFRTSIDHSAELTLTEGTTLAGNEQHLVIKETSTSEIPNSLFTIRANHSSLLKCQSGSLEMSNCSLTQQDSTHIPSTLIQILSGSSLNVNQTFFTCVASLNEKASVISAIITESTSFLLHNNTFTICTCSGQTNAIFLEFVNTTVLQANSFNYLMTDLVFDSPSSNTDTEIEIDVYVVGKNLDKTMTSTKWENSFSREKGSSIRGEDTATGPNISLLPYLVALEGPVEIDDDGKGFEKCGHFFMSCNSLELGLRRMKEASVDAMKVMERITATTQLEPQRDLCIEGNDESSTLSFSLDGCFVNSPKDATTSISVLVPLWHTLVHFLHHHDDQQQLHIDRFSFSTASSHLHQSTMSTFTLSCTSSILALLHTVEVLSFLDCLWTLRLERQHLFLSQSTLEEGLIVVNENGEVKLDSNTVSSLSTVQSSLIQLTGDQAVGINLTLTDQNGENHQNRGIIQLPCQHPFSPKPCTHEMDEHR